MTDQSAPRRSRWELWYDEAERYDRLLEGYGAALLDAAELASGDRILDVGCGPGATTVDAAVRVGSGGSVLGIDINDSLLQLARERTRTLPNVTFVCDDAAIHPYGTTFDAVISRFGIMLFEDLRSAFAHLANGLQVGGTVTYVVWTEPPANAWFALPFELVGHDVPLDNAGPFALADADANGELLSATGFVDIFIDRLSLPAWFAADVEDATGFLRRFMSTDLWDPSVVERAVEASRPWYADHATPDGIMIPTRALLCHARLDRGGARADHPE